MVEQAILVGEIVNEMQALFNIFVAAMHGRDLDLLRVVRNPASHLADSAVERCREKQCQARSRRGGHDRFDILDEPHVEHAVGFVEDENFKPREVYLARFHVIDEPTRGGDENRRITRQQFHLFGIGHAAENCHSLQVA